MEAVTTFLTHWSHALFAEDPVGVARHRQELLGALHARIEIRRMVRNPVMLTALAVVHWNERRLPEQRADLYESNRDMAGAIAGAESRSRSRRSLPSFAGSPSPRDAESTARPNN